MLTETEKAPPFDVVFMDMQMPVMDGITATKLLRTKPYLNNLPIIAMTAHALVEERQRCLDAGMNDHVSKPIDPDVLFATLMRWAQRHPSEESPVPAAAQTVPAPVEAVAASVVVPDIEGVDTSGGVKRVAGNKKLYRDLLGQFAAKQADAAGQISEALRNNDAQLAERIAHTVKGVAGNLGIATVQLSAAALEKAIRQNDAETPIFLAEFKSVLEAQVAAVSEALHATMPQIVNPSASSDFNPEEASAAATRLRGLLESSDGEAEEVFGVLRGQISSKVSESTLAALGDAIRDFDFDAASAKLADIVLELNLNDGKVTA